ncbi:MAG: glycosyltransferase [Ignavibacteriaceae bacterium]|nr:glycosyltransferase [Ignavibacteriaceae bacterium]
MTIIEGNKLKLLWVDHSYHKKTLSTNFLKEILEKIFSVNIFWDDYWRGGESLPVQEINKYDYVFFFQTLLPFSKLKQITAKIIWVPMFDGDPLSDKFWYCLSSLPIKIISFSEYLHKKCLQYNIQSLPLKYYLQPAFSENIPKSGKHYFFWYRGSLRLSDIKGLIDPQNVDSFVYRSAPDPYFKEEVLSQEDIQNYKLQIIRDVKLDSRGKYLELLKKSNIYFAPRKIEGIGISFLEAIAIGMVVVAYNNGTMNEYIKHEYNGYLFDSDDHQINFENLNIVLNNSKSTAQKGWEKWENDKITINDFILEDNYKCMPINNVYFSLYSAIQKSEIYLRKTAKRNIAKLKGLLMNKSS